MSVSPAFQIKQGDTLPVISATLSTALGPINLTGCTVQLILTAVPTPGNCGPWGQQNQPIPVPKVQGACTIVGSPSLGNVQYQWAVGDTSLAGNYLAQFLVTGPSVGLVQSVPTVGYIPVQIIAGLG